MSDFRNSNIPNYLWSAPSDSGDWSHLVQFYHSDPALAQSVSGFIAAGLGHGEGVVAVTTHKNRKLIEEALDLQGVDYQTAISSGQLIFLDAHRTLSQFMVNDVPDSKKFFSLIGGLIDSLAAEYHTVRAYGEMVDVLFGENNVSGTIQLEELWNDLGQKRKFSLLCGYNSQGFNEETSDEALTRISGCHTHIVELE